MNLRDARVDLDGQVVAVGQFRYPMDDKGYFVLQPHDRVRIDKRTDTVRPGCLRLAAATELRDPVSGFLIAQEKGVTVIVPEALSSNIRAALRHSPPRTLRVTLSEQSEGLRWHSEKNPETVDNLRRQRLPLSDPDSSKRQLLSDWELEITCDGESLHFRLSAALFASEPVRAWEKNYIGHWSVTDGTPPRIEIAFAVDIATRVASFHAAHIASETQVADSPTPFGSTLKTLTLATAPIDTLGRMFAVSASGQWTSFETESGRISLTPHHAKKRLANGFLLCDTRNKVPSVSLTAVGIDSLLRPLWRERAVTLELRDGTFGFLIQDRAFHETFSQPAPRQMIEHVLLKLSVDIKGLQFSYRVYVTDLDVSQREYEPGWLQDTLTIPWEIVILRFPELLWHRDALLKGQL